MIQLQPRMEYINAAAMLLPALLHTRRPTLDIESMLLTKYSMMLPTASCLQYSSVVARVVLLASALLSCSLASTGAPLEMERGRCGSESTACSALSVRRWLNLTGSCFRDLGQPHGESSIAASQSFGGALPRLPRRRGNPSTQAAMELLCFPFLPCPSFLFRLFLPSAERTPQALDAVICRFAATSHLPLHRVEMPHRDNTFIHTVRRGCDRYPSIDRFSPITQRFSVVWSLVVLNTSSASSLPAGTWWRCESRQDKADAVLLKSCNISPGNLVMVSKIQVQ